MKNSEYFNSIPTQGDKLEHNPSLTVNASEATFQALKPYDEAEILANYTPVEQAEIRQKQKVLSSLAYYIGKDFRIPVELNQPGAGWHWDFKNNIIRIDPKDMLEKPMDYLRFVISHEAGHRRISRTEFIPIEVWQQKGFSFLMNAIEDPRDNNFVAANYPRFIEQMKLAYELNFEEEKEMKQKAKDTLGYQPRFMQAGFEFIKLWFREKMGEKADISADLPETIKSVVDKTRQSAMSAWQMYPTKIEADNGGVVPSGDKVDGEGMISEYAKQSYEIILEEIWPEYEKLVEADVQDQKMSEMMKEFAKKIQENEQNGEKSQGQGGDSDSDGEHSGGGDEKMPKDLKEKLTPEEQKELEKAIEKAIQDAIDKAQENEKGEKGEKDNVDGDKSRDKSTTVKESENGGESKSVDVESLSPSLKKKIKDYIDSLPEDEKRKLSEKAEKSLKDFEVELSKEIEGKLSENPEEKKTREDAEARESDDAKGGDEGNESGDAEKDNTEHGKTKQRKSAEESEKKLQAESEKMLEKVRSALEGEMNDYENEMRRLAPQIEELREKLAEIFMERRKRGIRTGFEEGEEIDVERRLQEKAKGIPIFESRAWRRTELPREKDYAISLLVDLSCSMIDGNKIDEAYQATILLAEVLSSLGIKAEILGFNVMLYEYQKFNERLSGDVRKKIITMKRQVSLPGSEDNDDGWAVTETAKRLEARKEKEKLLLVISDGEPDNSREHNGPEYELGSVVEGIMKKGQIKIVGLGLGSSGVSAVRQYYPNHLVAGSAEEMIKEIGGLLLKVIKG